jgi:hypothetical protein
MEVASVVAPSTPVASASEATEVHTRLLRLALGVEESRAYWERLDPSVPSAGRPLRAFQERWFGGKSLDRVRFLLSAFSERFDQFPGALDVLRRFAGSDPITRQLICHFHVQLSDPIYRSFTGRFLVRRRDLRDASVDRDVTARWIRDEYPGRWAAATEVQFASKLLSAASEAGVITSKKDPRTILIPKVSDLVLGYVLYMLRGIRFEGTLVENPYLASLGLTDRFLEQRLRVLSGVSYRRLGDVLDFEWEYPNLIAWAEGQA